MKLSTSFSIATLACLLSFYAHANQSVTYTYNEAGQVLTEDGPRTDVNDITTNTYNAQGLIATTTNALWHVTTYNSYDASGNLLSITDANGVITEFTYHERGWLLSSLVKHPTTATLDSLTTYTYDAVGQMLSTTLPNGVQIFYEYDDARRLKAVRNAANERIEYTLDAAGNRTQQIIKNAGGTITYSVSSIFDELSRVMKVIGNNGQQDQHQYDVNDNRTATVDGRTNITQQTYDALNRVKKIIDPNLGETQFTYNSQDQIKTVTDARGNTTTYNYDGLGNLISQTSPDTGTTTFTYDAAGNRLSQTDARGVVTNYTYDALNRLTSIQYPAAPAENITYSYDSITNGNYGIGRLASIVASATHLDFEYNHQGLITKKYAQEGNTFATTQYRYDAAGNLMGITYPSGREVNYQLDILGRVSGITTKSDSSAPTQTILSNIGYLPFGPANTYQYGNNLIHNQTYDQDYRLTNIQVGGLLNRTYGYDPVNNIISIVNSLSNTNSQSFSYDALNRLITANGGYGNLSYGYDAVGNRLNETRNSSSDTYQYETTSYRLTGITRANGNRNFTYDAAGNPIQRTTDDNSTQTFNFNNANRLSGVSVNGTQVATYTYNALGQRIVKTLTNGSKEIYHYDESGQLLTATDGTGTTLREYLYWGNQQIALAVQGAAPITTTSTLNEVGVTFQGSHLVAANTAGYYGTGFIDYVGEGQANWSFNAASASTYTFNLRYSLGAPNRPLALLVDGVQQTLINFSTTASWSIWNNVQVSVSIPQGNHTISLKTTGKSGPNIDQVEVSYTTTGSAPSLYYIHNDHLNTPQVITNQSQQVVWMGDYEPFGKVASNANNSIEIFSRFPGQYLDSETGLYYNYFRDYDPSIGRYIESDPIGLEGGINTYAYVGNNPLNDFDPLGLNSAMGCANPANAAACAAAGIAVRVTPVQCPPDKDPDDECKKLEEKVRKAKDKMGTYAKGTAVCKEGMSWWQLRTRKNDWLDLAQARAQRDQKCFNGGDPDHQDAQITAWRQVVICGSLM